MNEQQLPTPDEGWCDREQRHRFYSPSAMRAALAANVPAGYKLVPVDPTEQMMRAAVVYANGNAVYKNVAAEALAIEESIYGEVWAAMLAAAPAPEATLLNGLTEAKTSASPSVAGLGAPAQAQQSAEPLAWLKHHPGALKPTTVPGCTFLAEDALAMGWEPLGRMTTTKAKPEAQQPDADLAMMLRRCASALQSAGRTGLQEQVLDLLRRKGLQGSPLREAKPEAQQPLTWEQFVAASDDEKTEIMRVARMVERICAEAWGVKLAGIGASGEASK